MGKSLTLFRSGWCNLEDATFCDTTISRASVFYMYTLVSNDLCGFNFSTVNLWATQINHEGGRDVLLGLLGEQPYGFGIDHVACIKHVSPGERSGYGAVPSPSAELTWQLFLDVYDKMPGVYLSKPSDVHGKESKVYGASFVKCLSENDDLSYSQKLWRAKHFADNHPESPVRIAWYALGRVQAYSISTPSGDHAWLLLPEHMALSFDGAVGVGFLAGSVPNPKALQPLFDACLHQFYKQLPAGQRTSKDEPWCLQKTDTGFIRVMVDVTTAVAEEDSPVYAGGGAAGR